MDPPPCDPYGPENLCYNLSSFGRRKKEQKTEIGNF
jgi:hypothetical protein